MRAVPEIVDAQIHDVWPRRKWSDGFTSQQNVEASVELAIASMDAAGVSAAVLHPITAFPELIPTYLGRYPDRFAVVPAVGPGVTGHENDNPDEVLAELAASPGFVGARLVVSYRDGIVHFREGRFEPYLAAAERHQVPVFMFMAGYLPELHDAVRAFPGLTFVIDHIGLTQPPLDGVVASPELFEPLPDLLALSTFPNVVVKFSSVPTLSQQPYPFDDLWPHVRRVIDAFGAERLMWGSDFTRCKVLHSYRDSVNFVALTSELSASEKDDLLSGSIRRWLNWPPPQA